MCEIVMDSSKLKAAVEALIFASERPIKVDKIAEILSSNGGDPLSKKDVNPLIEAIAGEYENEGKGLRLAEVADGYQFRTKKELAPLLQKLKAKRPPRFGKAAMEVLAIVAYRQPMTRAEVEDLRGVDSGGALRGLLEKRLVKILGRREIPGKPMIYGTTKTFLEHFSLRDLSQLPPLKEFVELEEKEAAEAFKKLEEVKEKG